VVSVFAAQLVRLQGIDASATAAAGEKMRRWPTVIPAVRGQILDRFGSPLATSIERRAVIADQQSIPEYTKVDPADKKRKKVGVAGAAADLAPLIGKTVEDVTAQLTGAKRYVILVKAVEPIVWRQISDLGIPGISSEIGSARGYPAGSAAAAIVGFEPNVSTSTDASGKTVTTPTGGAGMELVYNGQLTGTPGETIKEYGLDGRVIPMGDVEVTPAVPGRDVRLTLDTDLNWLAYNAVARQVQDTHAESGYAVVMDRTGHILAATQYPTFDPTDRSIKNSVFKSLVFQDSFEPGSTAKVMSIGAALDQGVVQPEDVYEVPYAINRANRPFHDSHSHATEQLTVAGILAQSSNVGTIKVSEKLAPATLEAYYRGFGAGQKSATGFPGESTGIFPPSAQWNASQRYTVLFGQGLAISAIQAAGVYQTVANDGVHVPATLVAGTTQADGTYVEEPEQQGSRVLTVETSNKLRRMLESVVGEGGTAKNVEIPGYRIAGKTGTAERYRAGDYTASFIGMAPAENPQVIVAVIVQSPKKGYYGGAIAGPVFREIMIGALKSLNIPPSTQPADPYPLKAEKAVSPAKPSGSATSKTTSGTTKATTTRTATAAPSSSR
jgi:cell division protein FtsI (penicillin-binding protein 3)